MGPDSVLKYNTDIPLSFGNRFGRKKTFYLTWAIYAIVSILVHFGGDTF